ncbi:MAG: UDP-N-acetylmuramoyl-L-alanyl-D-glutamate--2,6-diaminopimelate ligase [Candidatus Paceibacterota bacterium]
MKNFIKKLKSIWWAVKLFVARIKYGNPSKRLKIIGVTGTNGKTTTVTLLHGIANRLGHKSGLIGTVEILIGEEKLKLSSNKSIPSTTPDSVFLTKIFAEMVKKGCEYVFMEVSSHALDQNRVAGINFTGGIFTNLTHDHLDYHKSIENYFRAKKKFFEMLSESAFALSNRDDEYGNAILDDIKAERFLYGFGEETEFLDFYGKILKMDFTGLELDFNGEKIHSKLLGKFNAYNLLAVWGACKLLNFDMPARNATHSVAGGHKVNKILEYIEPPKGRFDHYMSKNGVLVIIDYAHSPDALEKVLLVVKDIKSTSIGRIISVFGCGGDRDPLKRPKMGLIGAKLSDVAIFTSDNPRSEVPEKIIDQMKGDLSHDETIKVITIPDRRLAIKESVELAKKGDIILCAGKGHEDYQEIKGVKNHFDDMEEFKKVLQ